MSSNTQHEKPAAFMTSVGETIGSAMGSIAAHASEVAAALSPSNLSHTAEREGKKLVRKSKSLARTIQKKATTGLRHGATATRQALRGASKAKRARKVAPKRKAARRSTRKK